MHAATAPLLRSVAPVAPQASAKPAAPAPAPRRSRADNAMSRHMGVMLPPGVQAQMQVSSASDPAEKEADATARSVMRMDAPAPRAGRVPARLQRSALPAVMALPAAGRAERPARRSPAGTAQPEVEAGIRASLGGGSALPVDVREFMEPRFRADFSGVRIHTDTRAAGLAARLGARAFAFERHIFFAGGEFRPSSPAGAELIAHELTHTIQQRAVVQRSEDATVSERTTAQVQRFGVSDILDGLAELAANVPGFTLLTLIIGRNPINMRVVERNAANLLRAFMGLIPGGEILFQVLQRYGVIQRLGEWVTAQTAAMGLSFQGVHDAFTRFTGSLGLRDIFDPAGVWRRAREIFTPTITRIRTFASGLVTQAIAWLKETFTQPLADFCREIPGYGVVKVMHGSDPFTGVPEPRTALNVVRAFAEFIPGGAEKVTQLSESGALQRAYDWFIRETQARNLTWARISGTFAQAWNSLRLEDVLHPIDTLRRMVALFRPLMADLVSFAGAALMQLLEFIYEAAMGAGGTRILAILKRARSTFLTVIRDPVRFLGHLMAGVGLGVRQFMTNILRHLRDGVIAWLAGPVARSGIQMPERWDVRGIIWFVLQILGLSWTRIRQKLVRLMGERPVALLEAGFQLLQEIRERGLVQALRDRVTEFFGNLRESALGAIRSFIQQRLVMAGITQLLSLLSPVGAIIQAIIKTYTTIQFFIQRINQILDLVEAVVDSIAAIAAGAIGQAANFVERTMARTIPVILDFLARFIGLGDVGGQVQRTIQGLQARVDQMLDRAVDWIRNQARNLASRALGGDPNATPQQRLDRGLTEGQAAVNRHAGRRVGALLLRPLLAAIRLRHQLQTLDVVQDGDRWAVEGTVNPRGRRRTDALAEGVAASGASRGTSAATAFEIAWPKRPLANYASVWLVPTDVANGLEYTQAQLRGMPRAQEFRPAAPRSLFGGPVIGIAANYRTSPNKTYGPAPHSRQGTPQLDAFKRLMSRHGYDRARGDAEGTTDADHVSELQMVGPSGDAFSNLWPLNYSENRSSGSTLSTTRVTLQDGTSTMIRQLAAPTYYFKITSFLH